MAFVQKATFTASNSPGFVTPSLTTTAGNTAVLTIGTWNAADIGAPSWTDGKGNTPCSIDKTQVETSLTLARASVGKVALATGGAGHTWTTTLTAGTYCEGDVSEFSDSLTIDQTGSDQSINSADLTISATSGVTTSASELVIGVLCFNNGATSGTSDPPDTGYTSIRAHQNSTDTIGYGAGYQYVVSTGAQTASWTVGAGTGYNAGVIATYAISAVTSADPTKGPSRQIYAMGLGA